MNSGKSSQTANGVAILRAVHQLLDNPLILADPIAIPILGSKLSAALAHDPYKFVTAPTASYVRAYMVARSRYAEDTLAQAVAQGVRQYVILGAGLDTFAYRNPYTELGLRVLEMDHPSTQAWKQSRLQEANIPLPPNLTFAPIDFENQNIAAALARAGFDCTQPAFFSCLGVMMYLTAETVLETLKYISSLAQDSGVVFDYGTPRGGLTELGKHAYDHYADRVAAMNEPWVSAFASDALVQSLCAMGFRSVRDVEPADLHVLYFQSRTDGLRNGSLTHLINARV